MKVLFIVFVISLSLATLGVVRAETQKTAKSKSVKNKDATIKNVDKKTEDCETKEDLKKKIETKPATKALIVPAAEVKSDGFSLKGASTGCSL